MKTALKINKQIGKSKTNLKTPNKKQANKKQKHQPQKKTTKQQQQQTNKTKQTNKHLSYIHQN